MSTWLRMRLGDFVTLQRGHDLPTQSRKPGMIPIMGSFGITGHHNVARAQGPGVTIGRSGASFGVVSYSSEPFWPLNTALYVVDFHGNDERFAYYFLKQFDFSRYNSGSAQPSLNRNFIHPIPVKVPPLGEQQRIAYILGTLDDKIELTRQMNRTLEAIARAIFKSWFIDFDPVIDNAILSGKPIPDEFSERAMIRREILAQSNSVEDVASYPHLFPDSFQDSPLGKIPEGWQIKALDQIADFVNGAACQKYSAEPGKPSLPVIKIRELGQGVSAQTDRARLDVPEKHRADDGDVLFSWSGTLLCKIWTAGPCFVNQHLFKVASVNYPRWLYLHWIKRHLEAFRGVAAGKATTMGHIKRSHLSEALAVVPGSQLLTKMTEAMAPIVEAQIRSQLESKTLAAYRDSLLPRLLSGEMSLADEVGATEGDSD